MKFIDESFVDQEVIVKSVNFKNNQFNKKLKNIGLYPNQIIKIKKIGNYKNMIGIEINNIVTALRTKDAKNIYVEKIHYDPKKKRSK